MAQTHQGPFKTSTRKTTQTQIRFLSPTIAVVQAHWTMSGLLNPDGSLREPWEGIITRVVQKVANEWVVVAAQNTDVAATAKPAGL